MLAEYLSHKSFIQFKVKMPSAEWWINANSIKRMNHINANMFIYKTTDTKIQPNKNVGVNRIRVDSKC